MVVRSLLLCACSAFALRAAALLPESASPGSDLLLDGAWEAGENRTFDRTVPVPGLAQDPTKITPGTLWYRREVKLPRGDWTSAELELKGARFAPAVYVNGELVSSSEGGMAPTRHLLRSSSVQPGKTIMLEVALKSLADVDRLDASATPAADRWRSNVSAGLWDSVRLHLFRSTRLVRVTPWTDFARKSVAVHWELAAGSVDHRSRVQASLINQQGHTVATSIAAPATSNTGECVLDVSGVPTWSPEAPNIFTLRVDVLAGDMLQDRREQSWGLREFRTSGTGFMLNAQPVHLRAGTVVWHRFLRDPEARTLAFDVNWFEHNIVDRLLGSGANTLRFHLGTPPEALLELCDRRGLLVQLEWLFFHGVAASPASMRTQWRSWLDVAMRHPCVVLLHPWNETEGEQLKAAQSALNALTPDYPPLVISHRDVIHLHKYWWSLFENLGLYYDSAAEFPQPIMADEFGGNYLDGQGNAGGYPTVAEAFLRFLGRNHTRELRLQHHAEANARVAEYWRQLGAAGFSPFCILGAPEDGNHWFLGPLTDPEPKPVWTALSAAYAPQSVSFALWNRNFAPGEAIELPVFFFNDRHEPAQLEATLRVLANDGTNNVTSHQQLSANVPANGVRTNRVRVLLPNQAGEWRIEANLLTKTPGVTAPVTSSWRVRTLGVKVPDALNRTAVGVAPGEAELRAWLRARGLSVVDASDPRAGLVVGSERLWKLLTESAAARRDVETTLDRGASVVLLDVGPRDLARYQAEARANYDGAPKGGGVTPESHELAFGTRITFRQAAEPESHIHPAAARNDLWRNLPHEATWLWNGLRGGLIVPPSEMEVTGLNAAALAALWSARGADRAALDRGDPLFAYELGGYFAFSSTRDDKGTMAALRTRVKFLVEDAPSLQGRINPEAKIEVTDVARAISEGRTGAATDVIPLASCGKNLTRVPVVLVEFGTKRGRLVVSQLLTAGRLQDSKRPLGLYELGHDPAAEQLVLNMLALAASPRKP